ncbi:MAG: phosphatidate cytidylyltransferase [Candidatus Halalkalibacterium sp. M3_1C_030]
MSELAKRILFAVPAAAIFLYVTWIGGWTFAALIIAIGMLMQHEMINVSTKAGFKPDDFFPYTIGLWILLVPVLPHAFEIGVGIFLVFTGVQIFKNPSEGIGEMVSTLFCGIYAPLGMLMFLMTRNLGETETGFVLTLSLLLMVWGNDIFAYFGGKYTGSHLMAPDISPKKTWEGFIFGVIGAVSGLLIVIYLVPIAFPVTVPYALPLALLLSIFGPLGDLAISKMKRAAGLKDTANILPGHGGFLDRFDALILAAPAFYLYIYFLEVFGYAAF